MRIHWKCLWVLLFISLVPMFFMRGTDKRLMGKMGYDLATRTRAALIRQASLGLKSLVEEHAQILRRERDIVEMALQIQATELEKKFASKLDQSEIGNSINTTGDINPAWIETQPSPKYFRYWENMRDRPLPVSFREQTYQIPPSVSKTEATQTLRRISGMASIYRSLGRKHPDLIVWQLTALENGIQSVYPSVQRLPMMYNEFKTKWYQSAKEKNEVVWSPPMVDPFTMQIMSVVSTPFSRPDGSLIGVTAIAVPIDVLLQESEHIRKMSKNCTSLLVRLESPAGSANAGIRIIAQERVRKEMHHYWGAPLKEEWLEVEENSQLEPLIADLQNQNTDVREIIYRGQESLMAYGSIDDYQTALLVIVPKADVVAEAVAMEKYVNERVRRQIRVAGIILFAMIPAVIFLALILSKSVTQNISKLVSACRRVGSGDFTTRVQIDSGDEIGELGKTFNKMIPALDEHVSMKQALDLAMEVQQNLLPQTIPKIEGFDIAGRSIYCDETGGDYYDFLEVRRRNSDHIGIAVGDVSGHGISAALLMASARAFLRSRVSQPGGIAEIVTDVNRLVSYDTNETGQFMTLFYAEIDNSEKTLKWVRAGHDPALLYDSASDSFEKLGGEGMALGVDIGYTYREGGLIGLSEGQILLIGTDGLWETQNESGKMFGKERLKAVIRQQAGFSSEVILAAILDSLNEFRKSAKQEDDVTLTVVKVVG